MENFDLKIKHTQTTIYIIFILFTNRDLNQILSSGKIQVSVLPETLTGLQKMQAERS